MPRKRKVPVVVKENVKPQEKLVTTTRKPDKSEKPSKKQKREPDWAADDGLDVIKMILTVQKSDCNLNKCTAELTKLYKKVKNPQLDLIQNYRWIFLFLDGSQGICRSTNENDSIIPQS